MSKRRPTHVSRVPTNLDGPMFAIEEITIGAWTPERDGKGKLEQVHVMLRLAGVGPPLVMRFKSAAGLDNFVRDLRTHRNFVWPGEPEDNAP